MGTRADSLLLLRHGVLFLYDTIQQRSFTGVPGSFDQHRHPSAHSRIWSRDCRSRHTISLRVADLTYERRPVGFGYQACLLDVSSRKCIGRSLSRRIDAQLPGPRDFWWPEPRAGGTCVGLIHHSDRGRQYCSNVYVDPWTANPRTRLRDRLIQASSV
jgi:transposase InsO family protein